MDEEVPPQSAHLVQDCTPSVIHTMSITTLPSEHQIGGQGRVIFGGLGSLSDGQQRGVTASSSAAGSLLDPSRNGTSAGNLQLLGGHLSSQPTYCDVSDLQDQVMLVGQLCTVIILDNAHQPLIQY